MIWWLREFHYVRWLFHWNRTWCKASSSNASLIPHRIISDFVGRYPQRAPRGKNFYRSPSASSNMLKVLKRTMDSRGSGLCWRLVATSQAPDSWKLNLLADCGNQCLKTSAAVMREVGTAYLQLLLTHTSVLPVVRAGNRTAPRGIQSSRSQSTSTRQEYWILWD